ncbi:MAG: Crp/Fnr family transcriptional regulator [Rhodocyclales bacterium]|nr:Crp/Fnr family transcriptional regulator [Rhodocyclales bacterium]
MNPIAVTHEPLAATATSAPLCFERGQRIHEAGAMGFPWRVSRGVVRFDTAAVDGELSFAGLAMEGDLVGTEVLMFGHFAHRATALTPCQLEPWPGRLDQDRAGLLQALARAEQRAADIVALRSGQAMARVCRLIELLLPRSATAPQRTDLPPLRDMAEITALTGETVSRMLSGLRRIGALEPERERRGNGSKTCRVSRELLVAA